MALSNWDTFAIDHEGKNSGGSFTSAQGVTVETYKNWLYISDPQAWRKGGGYTEPIVMQVSEGIFIYQDVRVVAIRGPKNGIYFCAYTEKYENSSYTIKGIVGIGCSGYVGSRWVGTGKRDLAFLKRQLLCKTSYWQMEMAPSPRSKRLLKKKYKTNPAKLKSVTKTRKFKKVKYNVHDIPEVFQNLDLSQGVRFNQGNAFFAANMGTPLQESKPGEATEPMMTQLIDEIFPKKE